MIKIREEAEDIISGRQPKDNNLLKNAPHPIAAITLPESEWNRPYTREQAVFPLPSLRQRKFWPTVSRIDDGECHTGWVWRYALTRPIAYGDINLVCECPSVEELASN